MPRPRLGRMEPMACLNRAQLALAFGLVAALSGCCRHANQPTAPILGPPASPTNPFAGSGNTLFQDTTVPPPDASIYSPGGAYSTPPPGTTTPLPSTSPTGTPSAVNPDPIPRTTTRPDGAVRPSSATSDDSAWRSAVKQADLDQPSSPTPSSTPTASSSTSEPPLRIVSPQSPSPTPRTATNTPSPDGAPSGWVQPTGSSAGSYGAGSGRAE
jgi:hypothetical protein